MLYWRIIAVYSENQMKMRNTLSGRSIDFRNFAPYGANYFHFAVTDCSSSTPAFMCMVDIKNFVLFKE